MNKVITNAPMTRLPFELPEWTRTIWTSQTARQVWEPRISCVGRALDEVERETVIRGLRPSALQMVGADQLRGVSEWAARRGLVVLPLQQTYVGNGYTSAGNLTSRTNTRPMWRIAITSPEHASEWFDVWDGNDNRGIGRLLGFPPCCVEFFQSVWVETRLVDTSWAMFENSNFNANGPFECNILGRWIGVRTVSHLPCSFQCRATEEIGKERLTLMREMGYRQEADDIEEILSWPVEWSGLHGIAEVKFPILKVSTRTDATGDKYVLQRPGDRYPLEGAAGVQFPYRTTQRVQITKSKSFKNSLVQASEYVENGFSSADAMESAHKVLMSVLESQTLSGRVLDLGCGNGVLLEKLKKFGEFEPHGVESEFMRARNAQFRLSEGVIVHGSIFDDTWEDEYDTILISMARLTEATTEQRQKMVAKLGNARRVVFYAYGDYKASLNFDTWASPGSIEKSVKSPHCHAVLVRNR